MKKGIWKIEEKEASGRYVRMRGTDMRISISLSLAQRKGMA